MIQSKSSADLAELRVKDRMTHAIREFEVKQQNSNRQWLGAQVKECEAASNDAAVLVQRKDELAKKLQHSSWTSLAAQHNWCLPFDVLSIDLGQSDKGTRPPVSPDALLTFLAKLEAGINECYDQDSPAFQPVRLPDAYRALLEVTDGVHDTDHRQSGVCGVDGVQTADLARMAAEDIGQLPWGNSLWRSGWEVSTGFCLGRGKNPSQQWLTNYYCCRSEETSRGPWQHKKYDIKECERSWGWRVFYKEPERFQHSFFQPMVFGDLVGWLQFYQDWWDRETTAYPEWKARMASGVKLRYSECVELRCSEISDQIGDESAL